MRIHSASAFLLAKGFGSSGNNNNNDFAMDMRGLGLMPTAPAVSQGWGRDLGLLKMAQDNSDFDNSVARAFNNLNDDMTRQNGETLDAFRELSDSFKKLAETDLTKLFPNARKVVPAEAPAPTSAIAAAEEALDTSAPLAGSTFSHPSHPETFFSAAVSQQSPPEATAAPAQSSAPAAASTSGTSYMQSLRKTASFSSVNGSSQKASNQAAAAAANGQGLATSYLDALRGQAKIQSSDLPKRKVSYSAYNPQQQQQQQQPAATAGSSYLDAIGSSQNQPEASSYAPPAGSYQYSNQPAQYMDAVLEQQEASEMHYSSPPQEPYREQPPTPQPQNPYMGEPRVAYADPRLPKDAAIVNFAPDNEDVMRPGSAPKIETPRVRYVRQDPGFNPDSEFSQTPRGTSHDHGRIGAQRVSGYIPSYEDRHPMNGASYTPEPKPKAPRPVFSKKYSGIHSDFDEIMVNPAAAQAVPQPNSFVPRPTPKSNVQTRHSIAAQRVKDIPDWQNDFAHPSPDMAKPQPPTSVFAKRVGGTMVGHEAPSNQAKPEPPRSVFAQKVSGVADGRNGNPSHPKPEPPRSVFSQKVSGIADFNGPPPNVPKPEPPRSVFSQKVKGIADFNGPPPHVPKPEPPRSVFAQKIASNVPREVVASPNGDFETNSNVPKPNPRAPPQQQVQPYGRAVKAVTASPGFHPDDPEAMEAEGIRSVPLPEYYQAQRHQDRQSDFGNSFQVTPDDRIGRLQQDEYLR